jgi:hypothetical protein
MLTPFTLITLFSVIFTGTLAAPTPSPTPSSTLSLDLGKIVNGTFVPSDSVRNQHRAYYKDLYVKDHTTNKTVPNPTYQHGVGHHEKRTWVDLPRGNVCKIDAAHSRSINLICSDMGNCQDNSYETADSRLYNNDNGQTLGWLGNLDQYANAEFDIDGYRTVYMSTGYTEYQSYGFDYANFHLYGLATRSKCFMDIFEQWTEIALQT